MQNSQTATINNNDDWEVAQLKSLVDYRKGKKPLDLSDENKIGSQPYIDIEAFEKGNLRRFTSDKSAPISTANDILVVWDGARCGLAGKAEGAIGSTLMKLTPKNLNSDFLLLFLQSKYTQINTRPRGTGIPHVNPEFFWEIEVPIPSREIQDVIVKKSKLFATHIIKSIANINKSKKIVQKFRQSVLSAAVSGRLTEEWRKRNPIIESGSDLLARIKNERHTKYQDILNGAKKENRSKPRKLYSEDFPVIKLEEIEETIPENWTFTNVGFLAFVTKLAGFEYTKYIKLSDEGEVPAIRAQNVQMGRFVEENIKYISKEISDILDRSQLHGREILMVFIGAGTGNVCLAPQGRQWHLAPNVAKIDVDGIDVNYLFYYLQSPIGFHHTMSWMKATAQPSLSMETIRQIIVSVPPLEEQREIVRRITLILEDADLVEKQIEIAGNKADKLTQSILAKAFRGEL